MIYKNATLIAHNRYLDAPAGCDNTYLSMIRWKDIEAKSINVQQNKDILLGNLLPIDFKLCQAGIGQMVFI
jgi:hypothetical protein